MPGPKYGMIYADPSAGPTTWVAIKIMSTRWPTNIKPSVQNFIRPIAG